MKKLALLFTLGFLLLPKAQIKDSTDSKKLYIKANALFLPIGILNAGLEYQLTKKTTLQGEIFVSPWKSFAGKDAQVYMLGFEGRYYFNEAFKHFYVGANISAARFIIQKYNYWGSGTYQYNPTSPVYDRSDVYQDGFAYMIGATVGYQFQLAEKWNMDVFLGAGTVQSIYKGYVHSLGIRYDTDSAPGNNKSGEFLPYKGGIMISYRLK